MHGHTGQIEKLCVGFTLFHTNLSSEACYYVLGIEYKVVARYHPQEPERCIECEANDIIFIELPVVFDFKVSCFN